LPASTVTTGLQQFVERVLTRLEEQGVLNTKLHKEWRAVQETDEEEARFCRAASRLGLDPYAMAPNTSETLVSIEAAVPPGVLDDFLDTVDPSTIKEAAAWLIRAQVAGAKRAVSQATEGISGLQSAVESLSMSGTSSPWRRGYEMARCIRELSGVPDSESFDCSRWVPKTVVSVEPIGLQGLGVRTQEARCAVALPAEAPSVSVRFSQARVLGRALAHPEDELFVLSRAHADGEKLARAFAAEILAPASGISGCLNVLGSADDAAIEAIAGRFRVSPLVIRHQYDNQLLAHAFQGG
jgi:hypothetical protein